MIATAATQSGIWAQYVTKYNKYLFPTGSVYNSSVGTQSVGGAAWSVPTTAPNGLVYAFGTNQYLKDCVLVGKLGKPNESTKWYIVYADNPGINRPVLLSTVSLSPTAGTTVSGKGFDLRPILAPNGLMYLFPDVNTRADSSLVVFNPGSGTGLETASGEGTISGDVLTITSMTSGTFGVGQTISYIDPIDSATVTRTIVFTQQTLFATTGRGGIGTYKLDSVVPNNVVTPVTMSGSEFPTCTWEAETFINISTTKFSPAITGAQQLLITPSNIRGAVLAKDGYMYTMPGVGGILTRIAPRNTEVNGTSADIWEMHNHYNGVTANFINSNSNTNALTATNRFYVPKDENGTDLSKASPYPPANGWVFGTGYNGGPYRRNTPTFLSNINSGILHPNGKIYMFGVSKWIFILDPTRWSLGDGAIYSKNTLALRSDMSGHTGFGFRSAVLEKPISEYIAKVVEKSSYASGPTVTVKVTDSTYIYVGMTVTIYSGQGSFNNPSSIIVDSVDKANNTFVARDTTGANIIQQKLQLNDLLKITPTQEMYNRVKIFLNQNCSTTSNAVAKNYLIDPTIDTLYTYGPNTSTGITGSYPTLGNNHTLFPNGLITADINGVNSSMTHVFTGSEYPITNPGDPNNPKSQVAIYNTWYNKSTSIIPGYFGNNSPFNFSSGGNMFSGGTTFGINESMGKVIFPSSAGQYAQTVINVSGELVSIKGYSAFTKYFNYAPSDKNVFEVPANLNDLATSLYNCYVNKNF